MKNLTWWMRIVGSFYLLLTLMNLYGLFIHPAFFANNLPEKYQAVPMAAESFANSWMVFVFELGVLGVCLLKASGQPLKAKWLIIAVIWAEIFRGIVCDSIWIARGFDAMSYGIFIVIHLIIIMTGFMFQKKAYASKLF